MASRLKPDGFSRAAFVIDVDQRRSRQTVGDPLPAWEAELNGALGQELLLPFERTAGDELQGVAEEPSAVVSVVRRAARVGEWYVGVGFGTVELRASARASTGEAFARARRAVEKAKRRPLPVALVLAAQGSVADLHAETALEALYALLSDRSEHAWRVADLLEEHGTRRAVAQTLGVSEQAVGQVAKRAHVDLERRLADLACALLLDVVLSSAGAGERPARSSPGHW